MAEESTRNDGALRAWRRAFFADHPFCPGLLCTGVVLLWIQCILYARYIHVDGGLTTIAINFSRCAFIAIACGVALRMGFPLKAQRVLGRICIGLMTVASFLFFVQSTEPSLNLTLAASVCAGVGLAWGGGQCINLYVRLGIREAVLYTFLAMALSTIFGIAIAFVPDYIAYIVSMILPVLVLFMYRSAQQQLDERDELAGNQQVPQEDNLYGSEPSGTWVRLGFGIALFSFVLGASRGFPYGQSIELPPLFQVLQFLGVTGACLLIIYRSLVKRKSLRFSMLWLTQLGALALGVVLLATLNPLAVSIGATLIAITNLFQVAFLWFLSYDVSRHHQLPAYAITGAFWLLHLFFREAGRLAILGLGPTQSLGETLLVAIMMCLLAGSMGFLLTDDIPKIRPFFSDLEPQGTKRAEVMKKVSAPMLDAAALEEARNRKAIEYLQSEYHLTQREAEISIPLSQGRSTAYIAATLYLSDNTVRTYVKNIYAKMGIHSKQDLIDFMRAMEL